MSIDEMTAVESTALGRLATEGRLLNAVLKAPTTKPGRFGFRGDIALKFQVAVADEKRPPEYSIEQVLTVVEDGKTSVPFLSGYLHNFAYLKDLVEVLGDLLVPGGKYILFCNNIDLLAKYRVTMDGKLFYILPIDESTVWKEILELVDIDRNDIKKLNTQGKLDAVVEKALGFSETYPEIGYEDVLKLMGPVRNRNENRPV